MHHGSILVVVIVQVVKVSYDWGGLNQKGIAFFLPSLL